MILFCVKKHKYKLQLKNMIYNIMIDLSKNIFQSRKGCIK